MSTGVLSLDYSTADGEELEIEGLDEPFVLELELAEEAWACSQIGPLVMCDGSCVPRGSCADTSHQFCSFFDEDAGEWAIDPLSAPGNITEDGRRIVCEFNHLTDIASFMGPEPSTVINKPCFSCLDEFLKNPAGIIVVATCAFLLLFTVCWAFARYWKYAHKAWDEIAATRFAEERKRVLQPNHEGYTGFCENLQVSTHCAKYPLTPVPIPL